MKKRVLYACKGCKRITSTTSKKIQARALCERCRVKTPKKIGYGL